MTAGAATAGALVFGAVLALRPAPERAPDAEPAVTGSTGAVGKTADRAGAARHEGLRIRREGDAITVSGEVSQAGRRLVVDALREVAPHLSADRLLAREGLAEAALSELVRAAAASLRVLPAAEAVVTLDLTPSLALRGEAPDPAAFEAAVEAITRVAPVARVSLDGLLPPAVEAPKLLLRREGDRLVLHGHAPSLAARTKALAAAAREGLALDGGLQVARFADPLFDERLAAALAALRELRPGGTVEIARGRIEVAGEARDRDGLAVLEVLRERPPAGLGAGRFAVAAAPVSPYVFQARREAGVLRLMGHLPDHAVREALRQHARRLTFGEAVVDETRLGDGAPPRLLAAAQAGLDALSHLARGEVSLADGAATLTGEALYDGVPRDLERRLPAALPPGWSGRIVVSANRADRAAGALRCRDEVARLMRERGSDAFGSDALPAEASADLIARVAEALVHCPQARLDVEGFVPAPAGADALDISRRRALAVADRLVRAGVPVSRVGAYGRGEAKAQEGGARLVEIMVRP